jgi:hypothetical protein
MRYIIKLRDQGHPSKTESDEVLPIMQKAVTSFFADYKPKTSITAGVLTNSVNVNDRKVVLPQVSSMGMMIVESEGMTISSGSKFLVKNGQFSNNLAVVSNQVPANSVNGLARGYRVDHCGAQGQVIANAAPIITQVDHTGTPGSPDNTMVPKYTVQVGVTVADANGVPYLLYGSRKMDDDYLFIMPQNADPRLTQPDSLYTTQWTPTDAGLKEQWASAFAGTPPEHMVWQAESLIAFLKEQYRTHNFSWNQHRFVEYRAHLDAIFAQTNVNKGEVFKYFKYDVRKVNGQITIRNYFTNAEGLFREHTTRRFGVHLDEVIPNSFFASDVVKPGKLTFTFKVPEVISNLSGSSTETS